MGLLFVLETVFFSLLLIPVGGRTCVSLGRDGDMIVVDNMVRSLLRFYCARLVWHGTFGPPSENGWFAAQRYYRGANDLKVTWSGSCRVNKWFRALLLSRKRYFWSLWTCHWYCDINVKSQVILLSDHVSWFLSRVFVQRSIWPDLYEPVSSEWSVSFYVPFIVVDWLKGGLWHVLMLFLVCQSCLICFLLLILQIRCAENQVLWLCSL